MLSKLAKRKPDVLNNLKRSYNFASSQYKACFGNWDTLSADDLREKTIKYVDAHDPQTWYDDPQRTILKGVPSQESGAPTSTVDAFGTVNGQEIRSSAAAVDEVIEHMHAFRPGSDYRAGVRRIEHELLHSFGHVLAGNQALDFHKQDGITEIGEWAEAATVERRLTDLLLESEAKGEITIRRDPAFIGCVSNFSNFLDVSRKMLRNMEVGVPCVVLSRSNTSQHMFRWFQLLLTLCEKHGVDSGMLTYLCATRAEKNRVMAQFPNSPFYTTSSREVAKNIKQLSTNLMASTGGPNTMVSEKMTESIQQAAAWSTMIENSGQCTAMRALVTGESVSETQVSNMLQKEMLEIDDSGSALKARSFAGLFKGQPFELEEGYKQMEGYPVAFRLNGGEFPEEIEEMWRQTYLDVMERDLQSEESIDKLSKWLNKHQPISLAVNGVEMPFELFNKLFERTALVVYTIGCDAKPALTAQARPQDGEIFGEFPPRHEISEYTKFPMVIPSAPGYHSVYNEDYLKQKSEDAFPFPALEGLVKKVSSPLVRGYCQVLSEYLVDATQENPKVGGGYGKRTPMFGLQRPPVNTICVIRGKNLDEIVPRLVPFLATNAAKCVCVSTTQHTVYEELRKLDVPVQIQDEESFTNWCNTFRPWNVIKPENMDEFALVGQYLSLLMPCGHIKSTRENDAAFIEALSASEKWLRVTTECLRS